jgi:hypothetical protein
MLEMTNPGALYRKGSNLGRYVNIVHAKLRGGEGLDFVRTPNINQQEPGKRLRQ